MHQKQTSNMMNVQKCIKKTAPSAPKERAEEAVNRYLLEDKKRRR